MADSSWLLENLLLLQVITCTTICCFSSFQCIQKHTHTGYTDASSATLIGGKEAFIWFSRGALQEELKALKALQGDDTEEMMRAILYCHIHEQSIVYQPSHWYFVVHVLVDACKSTSHLWQYLRLLIPVQTVYCRYSTCTHSNLCVTMAVAKNTVGIQLILNKTVI